MKKQIKKAAVRGAANQNTRPNFTTNQAHEANQPITNTYYVGTFKLEITQSSSSRIDAVWFPDMPTAKQYAVIAGEYGEAIRHFVAAVSLKLNGRGE